MKQITFVSSILILILACCQGQQKIKSSEAVINNLSIDTGTFKTDSNMFYFPLESLKDTSIYIGHDTFTDTWYSHHLYAMREPVIFTDKSQNEIYRFTWLRTFHNPIAIRIEKHNDSYTLYWKLCNGAGGYQPGRLTVSKQLTIDKSTWSEFIKLLNQIDFWNLKTNEKIFGCDGSQWILEGKLLEQYHVVDRWTPDENSKFYHCCDFLIKLTDLKIKNDDKY